MKVIALSGSLRAASVNSTLLRATARLAPSDMNLIVFEGIGVLTLFNPDLESNPPRGVSEFQDAVSQSDALIIASPEYAHGMSGVMKNALDWLVGLEAFVSKPVAIYNASPRASRGRRAAGDFENDGCFNRRAFLPHITPHRRSAGRGRHSSNPRLCDTDTRFAEGAFASRGELPERRAHLTASSSAPDLTASARTTGVSSTSRGVVETELLGLPTISI